MNKYIQNGNGYYFSIQNADIGGQMEVSGYPDNTPPVFIDTLAQNNTNQVGGNMTVYNKIYNPDTKRMVNLDGKLGQIILKKYIQQGGVNSKIKRHTMKKTPYKNSVKNGGSNIAASSDAFVGQPSVFDPNMINRDFGCNQPIWEPSCM